MTAPQLAGVPLTELPILSGDWPRRSGFALPSARFAETRALPVHGPETLTAHLAAAHEAATAATRDLPDVLHVGTYTSTRAQDRTRPYHVTVKVGSIVRVHRFGSEREQRLYEAQARADVALLADRIEGKDR